MESVELNLSDIFEVLIKRWWLILICTVLCAAIAFSYSVFAVVPMYGINIQFIVNPQLNTQQSTSIQNEMQSYTYGKESIKTYLTLLKNNDFFDMLYDRLAAQGIYDYSSVKLKSMVSYTSIPDTELFNATVVCEDPNDAFVIAKEFETLAPERIQSLRGFEALKVSDPPKLKNIARVNNNTAKLTLLGALAGAFLSALFFVILKLTDVRITDESDIKKAYDIPILGVIPNFDEVTHGSREKVMYGGKPGENK